MVGCNPTTRENGEEESRTIVTFCETEGIPRPCGDEPLTIVAKRMQRHILNAMWLCRAPNHNIEPSARLRRKKIRAKGSEVGTGHNAAWGRV